MVFVANFGRILIQPSVTRHPHPTSVVSSGNRMKTRTYAYSAAASSSRSQRARSYNPATVRDRVEIRSVRAFRNVYIHCRQSHRNYSERNCNRNRQKAAGIARSFSYGATPSEIFVNNKQSPPPQQRCCRGQPVGVRTLYRCQRTCV